AWSQLNPSTWQFRVRENDAKFQNGEFFDAESVRVSFERVLNPDNGLALRPLVSTIDHVDIVNRATVNIVTRAPDAILPWRASLIYMLPPRHFAQLGPERFFQQPIGTGQWQLQDAQPGTSMSLRFFDDTWRAARGDPIPNLKQLVVQVLPESAARAAALRAGELDVALDLAPADAKTLAAEGYTVISSLPGRTLAFQFDLGHPAFARPEIRQAVNLAIDRQALLNDLFAGQGSLAGGQLVPKGVTGYSASVAGYPFDPGKARRLIERSRPATLETELWSLPDLRAVAARLAATLDGLGFKVSLKPVDSLAYVKMMRGGHRTGIFPAPANYGLLMDADAGYFRCSGAVPPSERLVLDAEMDRLFMASRREADGGV
ncbi:MAG: ABC transporter substrate-binding protein, partial [Chloroflexota bacterium]|nr:ABC transporter substrate-binding protein [Chloroflexota bacterium]